ncbi:MAG: DMT family transporter [Tissierellia bacterium]|nr:DMT family transporter [Tissierellia bacterium]
MKIGEIAALGAALSWTINGMIIGNIGRNLKANTINLIRLSFGLIFLSIFTLFTAGEVFPFEAPSASFLYLGISGIIGFAIGDFFFISSIQTIGPRFGMLMLSTSPILTAILDYILFGVKLSLLGYLGIVLTIIGIGIVVLSQRDSNKIIDKKMLISGLIFGILAATGQSVGTIFSKLGMSSIGAFQATQLRIAGGLLAMIVIHFFTKDRDKLLVAIKDKSIVSKMSIAGFLGPALGVGLSLLALKYTSAGVAATLTSTMPIMILPFSIFYYKEKISVAEILGTIMSIIGIGILFTF